MGHQRRPSALVRLADAQDGPVSHEQMLALGYTTKQIRVRRERGDLIPQHRGVYLVSRRSIPPRGYLRAALLATGPEAFLSHRTAAAVYGLRRINRYAIHVTIPQTSRRHRDNLILHRTCDFDARDVRIDDGLRVSTIPRMLIELAPDETERELDRLITEADRRDLLQIEPLEEALARHSRRPGTRTLRAVLGDYIYIPRDKSTLERDFAAFLAQDPAIPPPSRNVILEHRYEIDFYWPTHALAVELDGRPYHQAVTDHDRDNAKDIWLQQRGIRSLQDSRLPLRARPGRHPRRPASVSPSRATAA